MTRDEIIEILVTKFHCDPNHLPSSTRNLEFYLKWLEDKRKELQKR